MPLSLTITLHVSLFGILEVAEHFRGIDLNFEDTLVPTAGYLNRVPAGDKMKELNSFSKIRQFFISKLFYWGKILILSFLLIPLCSHLSYAERISPKDPKTILVLHTLKGKRPWNLLFNKYLTESLKQSNLGPYKLEIENLDMVEFNDAYHKKTLKSMLEHKYSNPSPDIIIISFSIAHKFVVENNLFPDVPKIIISVVEGGSTDTDNSAVLSASYDFKGNIEHCLTLRPGTKNIYVVAGHSNMDKRYVNKFKNVVEELSDSVSFHYLTDLSVETLLSRVKNLPPDSIVYYVNYTQDDQGKAVISRDLCTQLGKLTNRPVFTFLDLFALETGILGGRVTTIDVLI